MTLPACIQPTKRRITTKNKMMFHPIDSGKPKTEERKKKRANQKTAPAPATAPVGAQRTTTFLRFRAIDRAQLLLPSKAQLILLLVDYNRKEHGRTIFPFSSFSFPFLLLFPPVFWFFVCCCFFCSFSRGRCGVTLPVRSAARLFPLAFCLK